MFTNSILDRYRTIILNDKDMFKVLSILFRDGVIAEDEVENQTKLSERELKTILNKLYKSKLIKIVSPKWWKVSELAEEVLTRLGISESAAISYISDQSISEDDKFFLVSFLSFRAKDDIVWAKNIHSLLRALDAALSVFDRYEPIADDLKARAFYAAVIGSDNRIMSVDFNHYCHSVFSWKVEHKKTESFWGYPSRSNEEAFANICLRAVKDYKSSNEYLLTDEDSDSTTSKALTYGRLLSNISQARDTCEVLPIYNLDQSIYTRVLAKLFHFIPSLEWFTLDWSKKQGVDSAFLPLGTGKVSNKKFIVKILQQSTVSSESMQLAPCQYVVEGPTRIVGKPDMTLLTLLKEQVEAGKLDSLTEEERNNFYSHLQDLQSAFEARYYDSSSS